MSTALPVLETRDAEAMEIVKRNMIWAGGAGILPFPLFDLVAISGVQLKLINDLANFYDVPFQKNIAKTLTYSLLASLGSGTLAGIGAVTSIKWLPMVGPMIAATSLAITSAAVTYATGKVFIQHFEAGGTLLDFDPASVKAYFRDQFEQKKQDGDTDKAKKN